MKCPRCNAEVKKGEKYCNKCGKKIKSKKPIIISIAVVLVIALITVSVSFLFLGNGSPSPDKINTLSQEELTALSNENYVSFSEGFTDVKVTDEKSAFEAVSSVSNTIGINDVEKELKISGTNSFDGETFYRMQQYYNDIPVYGKDVVLASDKNGLAISLTANSINIGQGLNGKKVDNDFDDKKAVDALEDYFDNLYSVEDKGPYYVAFDSNNIEFTHLYTVLAAVNEEMVNFEVGVSNDDYKIVFTNDLVNTDDKDYSYKVSDSKYYMFDEKRNIVMLNSERNLSEALYNDNDSYIFDSTPLINVNYSDEEQLNAFLNYLNNNNDEIENEISNRFSTHVYSPIEYVTSNNNTWNNDAVSFMNNVQNTYDFYKDILDRNGYDGKNREMFAAYNDNFGGGDNAYSSGNFLCFGYKKDSSAVDLVAHEFTHSVERSISNMLYEGESGALKEAYSDIFGELAESYTNGSCNWVFVNGRNLKNPSKSKKSGNTVAYPQKYKDKKWMSTTDLNNDHGGVHTNCTVISHAAYLMNNGIDGDENMKISTELLAKIWYKSLFLLHPNATFAQCADAVYNAALMTDDVTFEQRVCIRAAFGEVGLDVEAITSYTVLNGTTVYAISKDNKKYQNYHIKVCDYSSGETIDEKDIVDDKGYKLDLDTGKYIISLTDNNKGSNNIFYKTINLRNIPEKRVESYINILTDFYFDYDKPLKEKLSELIDEYGIASTETYSVNSNIMKNTGWTNRQGIVCAKYSDLDGDGIKELVVYRLIGGDLNPYSENLELQVYYYTNDGVKSAGSLKFVTGDDFKQKQIDSFICKAGDKKYIFVESDFTIYGTDAASMYYDIIEYNNHKITTKKNISGFGDLDGETWSEKTWNGDVESENDFYHRNNMDLKTSGKYKNSKNPILDYMSDFGLSKTKDKFKLSQASRFMNVKGSEKLFEFLLYREQNDLYKYTSELTDFTDLDHSKATTSPDKVEEWKEAYINFLQKDKTYTNAAFSFSIVDVDENGIPELVTTGFAAAGTQMIWIEDGKAVNQTLGYGDFKYIPSDNLIYCQYLNHGMYMDNVYSFENQALNEVFSGTILPKENGFDNPGWFIGDMNNSVSEEEYNQALDNAFDFDSSKGLDYSSYVSGENIIQAIKDY